jgi:pimeloyl-ACP methyl ester carboxylesterase
MRCMDLRETFAWEGRRIAWGSAGSGPNVVFCHGTPWSSWLWRPFAEALSGDFTVYLWDMPGYGQSSKDADHPVDFGVQAGAFTALLAHWGLDRPHVVTHDYGGAVSLRTHLVHGVAYASLLMADVVAIPPSGSPFFRLVQQHSDILAQVPPYIHEALVRAYIGNACHRGLRDDELAELAAPWLGEEGQPAFYRQIAAYDERPLGHRGHLDSAGDGRAARRGHSRCLAHPHRPGRAPGPPRCPGRRGDGVEVLADPGDELTSLGARQSPATRLRPLS